MFADIHIDEKKKKSRSRSTFNQNVFASHGRKHFRLQYFLKHLCCFPVTAETGAVH